MKTVGATIEELYLTRVVTPILSPNTEGDVLREAKPRRIAVSIDLVWDGLGRAGRLGLMGLLFAILVFNTGTKLYAQTGQGTIKGRVTDSTGSVVAGAKVSVITLVAAT